MKPTNIRELARKIRLRAGAPEGFFDDRRNVYTVTNGRASLSIRCVQLTNMLLKKYPNAIGPITDDMLELFAKELLEYGIGVVGKPPVNLIAIRESDLPTRSILDLRGL